MALTLTATEVEMYAGTSLFQYQLLDYFGESSMRFMGPKAAEVINQTVVQSGTAANFADGQSHLSGAATIKGVEIPLTPPLKARVDVKRSDVDTRPDMNLLSDLGENHGMAVARGRTVRLMNVLSYAANAASQEFEVDTETTSNDLGDLIAAGIESIAVAMDTAGVPETNRYGLLYPAGFYKLGLATKIQTKDNGGLGNIQTFGGPNAVLPYLNFQIANCGLGFGTDWTDSAYNTPFTGVPTGWRYDMTGVLGIFWHKDAFAVRHQTTLERSAEWLPEHQSWLTMSRLHFGAKVLGNGMDAGLYILIDDDDS